MHKYFTVCICLKATSLLFDHITKGKQKQRKRKGPKTDPCGSPQIIFIPSALFLKMFRVI